VPSSEDQALLRRLIDERPIATLATLHGGDPAVSMVPFVLWRGTRLLIHVSGLATHTRDMLRHPRVALLVAAEPDAQTPPQAVPRVAFTCEALPLAKEGSDYGEARAAYLQRFPDAEITFGLADFALFALKPVSARLVAGFARAQGLVGDPLERWLRGVRVPERGWKRRAERSPGRRRRGPSARRARGARPSAAG
jgi:putative heme iron utilization protein